MIGAIIGDIVGSRFEFDNIKTKDFEFFHKDCYFTDDTVMTIAIAKAIISCKGNYSQLGKSAIYHMQNIGKLYRYCGYGGRFFYWIYSDEPKPYNSYGNGAGMRVSACGFIGKTLEEVKLLAKAVTEVSHNHPEGLKAAEAIAVSVFLARNNHSKDDIKNYIREHYYQLDFTLDEIRPSYTFNETAQNSTPQAIQAFLESNSFEDAIRNAISIGGDSDTIAAMTGAIAGAYYGVDKVVEDQALRYLSEQLRSEYIEYKKYIIKLFE